MSKCSIKLLVCVDLSPLAISLAERKADKYDTLLPQTYRLFKILHVIEQTLTVAENGIPNFISIDRATPVARTVKHPRRALGSTTSYDE